jgi:dienelactone hydrolase
MTRMIKLSNQSIIACALGLALLASSCTKQVTSNPTPINSVNDSNPPVVVQPEINQMIYLTNPTGGNSLKAILFIPAAAASVPAVVVMHGSGGLWSSTDSTNTKIASQFKTWIDSFRVHKIAALFIDSYTARGVKSFPNMAPPANLFLAAEFVRPRDAYAGLDYLRTLSRIQSGKIALLGFSHGGTSVLSTMVDAMAVAKPVWSVTNYATDSTYTDGVLSPAQKPLAGGFAAAVSYYPGAAMFNYYGRPGTPSDGKYIPYAPVMIHAAGNDPLYTTLYTNADNNTKISAYDGLIQKAQRSPLSASITKHVYNNANHSFDGVTTTGADGDANKLAKQRTIDFLKQYLFN